MKARRWAALLEADEAEYKANLLWSRNGIIRNVGCEDHPWTCEFCSKKFCCLQDCEGHCETEAHQNALWWPYGSKRLTYPDVPRWGTMCADGAAPDQTCSMEGGSPTSGGTSSRAAQSESPPPAAVLQDRPSAASAGTWRYIVNLDNVTFNGLPIRGAVLAVSIPCAGEPPLDATYVMADAMISGNIRPANSLTAHGPPPFFPLSQMRAGDLVFDDPSSLRRPMAQPGLASATFDASAQASSWQSTNGRHLPGMTAMFTNRPQPWMAHPKPPPPRPIEGAHAGAPWQSAASVRANGWRGRRQREYDGTQDSSDS